MNQSKCIIYAFVTVIILSISTIPTFGQKLEFYTGTLQNNFYDKYKNEGHYSSNYSGNWGFSLGCAIDSLKFEWHTLRISIQYDLYSGNMYASDGSLGSGCSVDGQIQKGILSLSINPINIRKLIHRMQLSIGITGSILIHESFSGDYRSWIISQGTSIVRLEDKFNSYSSNLTFGLQLLINYRIPISEGLELVPQYSIYYGLTKELKQFPQGMKSIRNYFLIGLRKKF